MVKRIFALFFTLLLFQISAAQDFSALWEDHFSYLNIKDIAQGNDKIYAAAENAVFTYDIISEEINKTSTINGLSGEIISSIHYSEASELLLIGYENGLIDIVFDSNQSVLSVVDIIEKETIPPNDKRINHFNEYEGLVYISTDYGISVYDLSRLEFGDSYFIGDLGSQKIIKQTTIFENEIYAATPLGLQKASVDNPNLIDYNQWETISASNWSAIEMVEDKLYAQRSDRVLFQIENSAFISVFTYSTLPVDVKSVGNNLVVTTANDMFLYQSDFTLIDSASINGNFDTVFTCGTISSDNTIYIGTTDYGVLSKNNDNEFGFDEIHPDGPLLNNVFSLTAYQDNLWVTYGDYNIFLNAYPLRSRGVSHLIEDQWINTSSDSIFGALNLNTIVKNPDNSNQVFISSFFGGLLEFNDNSPSILYNETNSGLESLDFLGPDYIDIRVSGLVFDQNGLLWSSTSLVDKVLKSFNPSNGQWQGYSFSELIANPRDNNGFKDLVIDDFGTKWLASYEFGVVAFNENGNLIKNLYELPGEGDLPDQYVTSLAIDQRNQLWIGTFKGLRVFNNINGIFEADNPDTQPVIILEDGVPKELLFQQYVSDIKVDGSNNKWLATIGSGLFLVSPDGRETIYHFTKDNSPLPSNNISEVSIDESSGKVYVGTEKGIVSFNAGGSTPKDGLTAAFVYPNPVRPEFNILDEKVKIKDISDNVNIKITDIEGNLVAEAQSRTNSRYRGYNLEVDGGTAYWNGKNLANNMVSSGVYLVMLSDLDTFETKVLKLMIVR